MNAVYMYDDFVARTFEPFALTRPISEMLAGIELVRARWSVAAGGDGAARAFIGAPHLVHFDEAGAPRALASDAIVPTGAIVANSRFVVALGQSLRDTDSIWQCGGRICAVRLAQPLHVSRLADGSLTLDQFVRQDGDGDRGGSEIPGRWIDAVWDYIATLSLQLAEDISEAAAALEADPLHRDSLPASTAVMGSHAVTVERGATIEPYVVL
ncbi:MAG: putative sugar nucleotidyl transferase, partial [Gemmatimonadaceae bacterium]